MASTITRNVWTDDTGTPSAPIGDGTIIGNAQLQNDIYARIDEMFSGAGAYTILTIGGLLQAQGFGSHVFTAGGAGSNSLVVRNTAPGAGNTAQLAVGNDASLVAGLLRQTSSTFVASGWYMQDGLTLEGSRVGGVTIAASHAGGAVKLFSAGQERVRVYPSGAVAFGGTMADIGTPGALSLEHTNAVAGTLSEAIRVKRAGGSPTDAAPRWVGLAYIDADNPTYTGAVGGRRRAPNTDFSGGVSIFAKSTNVVSAANAVTDLVEVAQFGYCNPFTRRGLVLTQGDDDLQLLELQSSDVAHAFTVDTNPAAYGVLRKAAVSSGGLAVAGYSSDVAAIGLAGQYSTGDTTKGASAKAAIVITGNKLNVNTAGVMGANENVLAIRNNVNTCFIFDAEGDLHYDGSAPVAYDDYDDVGLARALDYGAAGCRLSDADAMMPYTRADLERAGLVSAGGFINLTKHTRLLNGAVWQLHVKLRAALQRIAALEGRE